MRVIWILFLSCLFLTNCESSGSKHCTSCQSEMKEAAYPNVPETDTEISKEDKAIAQMTGDDLIQSKQSKKNAMDKKENHLKILRKYGEQWDFCACVNANDSINKVSQKGLTEKQAEKLMVRWEYVENKCREFMTNPNTTPYERALHEKKVKKCLQGR